MKVILNNGFKKLVVENKDNFIANKDLSDVAGKEIYLGKFDSEKNYIEITRNERDEILKKLEEERLLAK